jgi:hypothetical protein
MIEFKHNGRVWKTDTVDEAIALRRKLEINDEIAFEAGEDVDIYEEERRQVWTPDAVVDLFKGIGSQQKRFLKTLADGTEVPSEQILGVLGLQSEVSFAGVLSGLSKQLKKLGINNSDLYTVSVKWNAKNKSRSFRLSPSFSAAAGELGWPENWEQP